MSNVENLIPFSERTESEQRKIQSKGGKKSGETRRRNRDMRQCFKELANMPIPPVIKDRLESIVDTELPDGCTYNQALAYSMMLRGITQGDASLIRIYLDIMGESFSDRLKQEELKLKKRELAKANKAAEDIHEDELSRSLEQYAKDLKSDDKP